MAFKILSLDGGGIRGIIPGQILVALEEKLQQKSNNPDAKIGDFFDMVAGTSTGAILSAAYVCPSDTDKNVAKFSAKDAVNLYLQKGGNIFKSGFWRNLLTGRGFLDEKYSAKALEKVLLEAFQDVKLSDLQKPTCFVSYDVSKRKPILFTQHDAIEKGKDFFIRDALRASAAAPTYFEPAFISSLAPYKENYTLIDGGIIANDPSLCAYSEAINFEEGKFREVKGIKDMIIVSLGTGKELHHYKYQDMKNLGKIGWVQPSIDIALEGGAQMTSYHLKQIASTVENSKYFRLQPNLYDASKAMDDVTIKNINALKASGEQNALENDTLLEEIAELLVNDILQKN